MEHNNRTTDETIEEVRAPSLQESQDFQSINRSLRNEIRYMINISFNMPNIWIAVDPEVVRKENLGEAEKLSIQLKKNKKGLSLEVPTKPTYEVLYRLSENLIYLDISTLEGSGLMSESKLESLYSIKVPENTVVIKLGDVYATEDGKEIPIDKASTFCNKNDNYVKITSEEFFDGKFQEMLEKVENEREAKRKKVYKDLLQYFGISNIERYDKRIRFK
jgi:hypothetical protein